MPTFAMFCIKPAHWHDALSVMREFGVRHGLELHGGVEKRSDGIQYLNVYLARGWSALFSARLGWNGVQDQLEPLKSQAAVQIRLGLGYRLF